MVREFQRTPDLRKQVPFAKGMLLSHALWGNHVHEIFHPLRGSGLKISLNGIEKATSGRYRRYVGMG